MQNPWFKLDPSKLLLEIMDLSKEQRGEFLLKLAKDLLNGESEIHFIAEMIEERTGFIKKKSQAGKEGMRKRYNSSTVNHNSVITELSSDITITEHNITEQDNTLQNRTNNIKDASHFYDFKEVWDSIEWTKPYNPKSQSKKVKLNKRVKDLKKEFGESFFEDFKNKVNASPFLERESWFNLENVLTRKDIIEKLLNDTYDFLGKKKTANNKTSDTMDSFWS